MELISEARKVWIPNHPTEGYLPGRVEEVKDDGTLLVVDEAGGSFTVQQAEAQSVDPACLVGVDDLLSLGDFNEAALLHNVRVRFSENKIYTGIGTPILISVNPYQHIPGLYSAERQREYRQTSGRHNQGGPPVHLYSVADAAFRTMLHEQVNQSVIISGESGAGKTEATKRILAYLAEMQRSTHPSAGSSSQKRTVEQQVLDANPVLEAFGNAKTVRNDNSSRFGKFVEVEFDASGKLLSAQISNYLLEKCRIVTQQPDERNYHIFYQLCSGWSRITGLPQNLQLKEATAFQYTKVCEHVQGVDDASDFREVVECMTSLGFLSEERDAVLQIVAAVLHLGNLTFSTCQRDQQDGVAINEMAEATLICELLGIETAQLQSVLEHKTLEDPLTKKTIYRPHNLDSASHTRHSMAKVVYTRLFDWLVWRINESISGHGKTRKDLRRIGLLDIYGFEVFDVNSFEQLCINFANEKLQQHFNNHMFTLEQQMYTREGIAWNHITFQDNQPIIDALDRKPLGLFCLVDSECLMPSATDSTLLAKVHSTFKNSGVIYKPSRFASNDFAVAHYAGEVVYSSETFLEKNTDKLHADVTNLLKVSKLDLVKRLFTDARFMPELAQKEVGDRTRRDTARRSKRSGSNDNAPSAHQRQNVTVSMMFREQLEKLVEDLNKTNPRYVRCIKPNASKQPGEMDAIDVLRQLRCAGMLESIRIRRAGYAVRRGFKEFFTRFRVLAPSLAASGSDPDYRVLCQKLAAEVEQRLRREGVALEERTWQMGTSRIFMKEELERHFERLLVESAKHHVIEIQRRWRGYSQGRHYRTVRALALATQASLRTFKALADYCEVKRQHDAATLLQAALRGCAAQAAFVRQRRAVVCVQRFARGWRCRARIGKLKGKMAAERIRKVREEEQRQEALRAAREEALEKGRALEAMRQAMDQPPPPPVQVKSELEDKLREENTRLLERLKASEVAAAEGKAATQEELMQEIARLKGANAGLREDLDRTVSDRNQMQVRAEEADRTLRDLQQRARAPTPAKEGDALGALRTEILARIGESPHNSVGHGAESTSPLGNALQPAVPPQSISPAMASALRPIGEGSPLQTSTGRKTNDCQREIFEQLRKQWNHAQQQGALSAREQGDSLAEHIQSNEAFSVEQLRVLEEEVRRLRRENASLKTTALTAQEECTEKGNEAAGLLQQMSRLQAELQDLRYRHKGDAQGLRQQLQETSSTLQQQTEDMKRMGARTQEAEERASQCQGQMTKLEAEFRAKQEECATLDRELSVLRKERAEAQSRVEATTGELDHTRRRAQQGEQDWLRERDRLQAELRARENELANIKRVLDDVVSAHAPVEELRKWRTQAENYKKQYEQALRYNKEMTSAVGHMTQAASERGGDWVELQRRSEQLKAENQRKEQQLKMAVLEKEDMQKQLDNLQSSCSYFQNKYKTTANELKVAQREHATSADSLLKARAQGAELQRENEALRSSLRQQQHFQQQHFAATGSGRDTARGTVPSEVHAQQQALLGRS